MMRTQQDNVALAAADELQPAEDEGAHENLAQLGVLRDERPQSLSAQLEKLTRLSDAAAHQGAPPGDHRHLAGELTGAVRCYGALAIKLRLDNFHASGKEDEKRDVHVTGLKQDFSLVH